MNLSCRTRYSNIGVSRTRLVYHSEWMCCDGYSLTENGELCLRMFLFVSNWTCIISLYTLQLDVTTVVSHSYVWNQMCVTALVDTQEMENSVCVCSK